MSDRGCGREFSCFRVCRSGPHCESDEAVYMLTLNPENDGEIISFKLGGYLNNVNGNQASRMTDTGRTAETLSSQSDPDDLAGGGGSSLTRPSRCCHPRTCPTWRERSRGCFCADRMFLNMWSAVEVSVHMTRPDFFLQLMLRLL